ncbi:MAG TPA: hypothetical protein GX017_05685, partial [Clostridiales bacterium]|nr:hypothetical protein [Clostridiales bacterium]
MRKPEIWVKRPVLWVLAVYAAGLVFSLYLLPMKPVFFLLAALVTAGMGVLFRKKLLFPVL